MAGGGRSAGRLDLEATYTAAYGHHPSQVPDLLQPEFVGMVRHASREAARRFLADADATSFAIAQALDGKNAQIRSTRSKIEKAAHGT